ncbi:uncharacterized protein LOC126896088 [Daktulosphaira vitifoliae]|uniref:uncharacterized protein LOC126896088 n=1 Tax=Daktulosphaira vitifoliae TaxID=58002 RepID=UPI0021A9B3CD|nr:uncharacterized protein LOC126896088 [Daktulosphaira vitifoliae]XP_050524503.1 uncharacterized protein LOC126896088 [Daktulosphaira vitifoliae]
MGESVGDHKNFTESDINIKREMIKAEFYSTYDVMTGVRIASTLGGFFLMMVLLVLYKSKCKTRSLSDQHLEAVIKAAVDQEEQMAALAKRSSSSSYCSGHGLCRCSQRYSIPENDSSIDCNNWSRQSRAYLTEMQYYPYMVLNHTKNNKRITTSVLEYSFEEDENDGMEILTNNSFRVAQWLEVPDGRKLISRGNSVSSNDTSYLEARGSSLIVGHPPSPLNHSSSAGDPPWEYYYPIDIQVIQPTPCMTPCGSQDSFSDVPRHTQQLLPTASGKRQRHDSPRLIAPIASIRTSCSSCCETETSTANSSVFVDDFSCTSPLLANGTFGLNEFSSDNGVYGSERRVRVRQKRRYSSPSGNRVNHNHGNKDLVLLDDICRSSKSFHGFQRTHSATIPNTPFGKNVIVVQADVNPVADTIVNANSLSGSLRALYDASKETLF